MKIGLNTWFTQAQFRRTLDGLEPKTKGEATVWLDHFVPIYRRKCEEDEIEWEATHSDLVNNCGCWDGD